MVRRAAVGTFAALVCEAAIPQGVRTASLAGAKLPLPNWAPKTRPNVVVIGDTGCRVKRGSDEAPPSADARWNIQNCASPADWPFQEVAEHAVAAHPDLVIHVGDYLYREKDCTGVQDCPGGPSGDTLETWEADFFTPARALLAAAPWVFVRGNHEDCNRAGNGWFTLLEPRRFPACAVFTAPWQVHAGALSLAVLDDSTATDAACATDNSVCATEFAREVNEFTGEFRAISQWHMQHAWLLSHRPVWALKRGGVLNAALEAAWAKQRPAGIDLLLAGHTHLFEAIGFEPGSGHATQLVVGNSGTKLAPSAAFRPQDPDVRTAKIRDVKEIQDFGFTTLRPAGSAWIAEAHDRTGEVHVRCTVPMKAGRCAG